MKEIRIIGLLISDRIKEAGLTQKVLSEYSHIIKSRLGFHEVNEDICSRVGFIILQLAGDPEEFDRLEAELNQIGGLELQHMIFKT
jgi:glycine cleavage system regulatory protein